MYHLPQDVKSEIYHALDIDVLELMCMSNKESNKICSSKLFWENYFESYDLPIPKNPTNWIKAFKIEKKIKDERTQQVKKKIDQLERRGDLILKSIRNGDIDESFEIYMALDDVSFELKNALYINNKTIDDWVKHYSNQKGRVSVTLSYEPIVEFHLAKKLEWKLDFSLYDDDDEVDDISLVINKKLATQFLTKVYEAGIDID